MPNILIHNIKGSSNFHKLKSIFPSVYLFLRNFFFVLCLAPFTLSSFLFLPCFFADFSSSFECSCEIFECCDFLFFPFTIMESWDFSESNDFEETSGFPFLLSGVLSFVLDSAFSSSSAAFPTPVMRKKQTLIYDYALFSLILNVKLTTIVANSPWDTYKKMMKTIFLSTSSSLTLDVVVHEKFFYYRIYFKQKTILFRRGGG